MEFDTTLMTDEDKEAIAYAKRRGFKFPVYRCTTTKVDNTIVTYEMFFKPIHFRPITSSPFPECATPKNCLHLIEIWNRAGAGRYKYELIDAE